MKMEITREDVWVATMKDQPGSLAGKLATLSEAGANLEFIIARRSPDKPGTGVVFITPLKGAPQLKAAKSAGFKKSKSLHSLRLLTADKPGLGTLITQALAENGINLRGFSGAAIGKKTVFHLAFDTTAAATKAVRVLKKM